MKSRLFILLSRFGFSICLLFVILDFGFVEPAMAQSAGLAISPPVIEVLLAPNKKVVHAFELTNQGESGQFVANLHLITPTDSKGHVSVDTTPLDPTTIPIIITLANADLELGEPFSLSAGNSTQLVLSIEGANTDISIDTYLALVISPLPSTINDLSSSVPAISSLVLTTLTPDGNLPISLELRDFDLPLIHDSTTPLALHPTLTNTSDIMLRSGGELKITSPRGNHSENIKLYPTLTLSHSSRLVKALVESSDSPQNPQSTSLTYQPRWYYVGPYQFELSLKTEGGSQITSITKTVWLLPIRALIIIFLLALFITSLLISARKRSQLSNS